MKVVICGAGIAGLTPAWWRIAARGAAMRLTALPGGHRLLNVVGDDGTDVLGPVREESSCP